MQYTINEATLNLPDSTMLDATINILRYAKLGTSLVISRALMAENETLEANFEAQVKRLEKQVQELKFQTREQITIGPKGNIPAIEAKNQFTRNKDEKSYQFQLACIIPGSKFMLALTYGKPTPLGAAEAMHWNEIKKSLSFTV